jgi:hypothetical protein
MTQTDAWIERLTRVSIGGGGSAQLTHPEPSGALIKLQAVPYCNSVMNGG